MSTIDIEALSVLADAMDQHNMDCTAERLVDIVQFIYANGWQLTRKDPIIDDVVIAELPLAPLQERAPGTWPPPGIVNLFSVVANQAKVILNIVELQYAMKEGRPIVSASRPEDALRIWDNPANLFETMKFDGIEFSYHADPIAF